MPIVPGIVRVEPDRDAVDVLDLDEEDILEDDIAPFRSLYLDELIFCFLEIERPGDDEIVVGVERKCPPASSIKLTL